MLVNFDYFDRHEQPILTLCNPNNQELGVINTAKNLIISPVFNAVSELSFDVYDFKNDVRFEQYSLIETRRQIFVEGIGYFIITNVSETSEELCSYKHVEAASCEIELNNIKLNYFSGTFSFEELINQISAQIPRWTIGHVDGTIKDKSRTFDVPDRTVYNFLMTEVEQTYGCIFEFDIINRIINIFDASNVVNRTSIFLSYDNVLKNIKIDNDCEEIATALTVTGGNDLNISDVNPLGSNTIYNFRYYKNTKWMSQNLINAITNWENEIALKETEYSNILLDLKTKNMNLVKLNSDLSKLQTDYKIKETSKALLIADGKDLTDINYELLDLSSKISIKNDEISLLEKSIQQNLDRKNEINSLLQFDKFFNETLLNELYSFVYQSSYSEENIIKTEIMTYDEIQKQSIELYQKGKDLLSKICEPRYQFSIETENFIFNKLFLPFTEQIKMGCLIDVAVSDDDIASLILLKMEIDYEDDGLTLTFGNRYRLHDPSYTFSDMYNEATKSATTVSAYKDLWNYPVSSGKFNEMSAFINSSLDLTKNDITCANNQTVTINENGYRGKKQKSNSGTSDGLIFEPEEIWITNNKIVFSDDNFETAKTALGKVILPNGETKYGLIGDVLVGNLICGKDLKITNTSGDFVFDENGAHFNMFQNSGTVNLINNSGALGDTSKWDVVFGGVTVVGSNVVGSETTTGKAFKIEANSIMKQRLSLTVGVEYSFTCKIFTDGNSNPDFAILIEQSENPCLLGDAIGRIVSGWETITNKFIATQRYVDLVLDNRSASEYMIVGEIMLNAGSVAFAWSPAQGESYTTNVAIDGDGITVQNSLNETKTIIDSNSFRIKHKNETVVTVNKDETILKKTTVQSDLTIGMLKAITRSNGVDFVYLGN